MSYALEAGTERELVGGLDGDGDGPEDGATDGFGDGFGVGGADELGDAAADWVGDTTSDGSGDGATDVRLAGLAVRLLPGVGVTPAVASAAEVAALPSPASCDVIFAAACFSACPAFLALVAVEELDARGQSCCEQGMMTAGWLSALPVAAKITAPAATMTSTVGTMTPKKWNRLLGRL